MRTWFSTRPLLSRVAALLLALVIVAAFVIPVEAYALTVKRWPTPRATYSFATFFPDDRKATVREAARDWSEGAVNWGGPDYTFQYTEVGSSSDVGIFFGEFSPVLPDIEDGTLAYAVSTTYGPFWKSKENIVINSEEPWANDATPAGVAPGPANTYSLRSVVRHELGHAAGVGHSQDSSANMWYRHLFQQTSVVSRVI